MRHLASDFPAVWRDPRTPHQERKRMVRLLVEDMTLLKGETIEVRIRLKGGATRTLHVPPALSAGKARQTSPEVLREIDRLLDDHTPGEVAELLNAHGFQTGEHHLFTNTIVVRLCKVYHLRTRYDRLSAVGKLTHQELAAQLQVAPQTIRLWMHHGLLQSYAYNEKQERLYDQPDAETPVKSQGQKLSERRRFPLVHPHRNNEVHDEA